MQRLLQTAFPQISEDDLQHARPHLRLVEVAAHTVLMEEGDEDASMVWILSGGVRIQRQGQTLAELGPGQMVGEVGLFGLRERVASAHTTSHTRVARIDRASYEALQALGSPLAHLIEQAALQQLEARLRHADTLIATHATGSRPPWEAQAPSVIERVRSWLSRATPAPIQRSRPVPPIEILRSSPMFSEADEQQLAHFAAVMGRQVAPAGVLICTEGTVGNKVFVLGRGEVDVVVAAGEGGVTRLAVLGPGAVFGVTALIADRPRMASCVTRTPCELLTLDRATAEQLAASLSPDASVLRRAILRALIAGLVQANARLAALDVDPSALLRAGADLEHIAADAPTQTD